VVVDPAAYAQQQKQVTILLNKPFSFVSQATEKDPRKRLAWQLLTFKNQEKGCPYRSKEPVKLKKLAVCGRLDAVRLYLSLQSLILLAARPS
jgi:16S rRNA U516 pseudouridylate synthase RsuA-like enzyme